VPPERKTMFSTPAWLRDLGFASWLLVGFVLIIFGAGLVLLGLVAIAGLVVFLVVHGVSANSGDVSAQASTALDKIEGWLKDAGVASADAKADVKEAVPEIRETLVTGSVR
jgi:Tfp pilus assembly protein PilX